MDVYKNTHKCESQHTLKQVVTFKSTEGQGRTRSEVCTCKFVLSKLILLEASEEEATTARSKLAYLRSDRKKRPILVKTCKCRTCTCDRFPHT